MTDRERRFDQIERLLKEDYDEAVKIADREYSSENVLRLTLALQAKEKLDRLREMEV